MATKYTMTPEQISRLFKFSVDAILRHIHKGYWNGMGIYATAGSDQYRINPDAFGRWYRQMTEEAGRQEHNKKTIKTLRTRAVMVWIVVVVAFGLLGTTDSGGFLRGAIGISFITTIVVFIGYVIAANIFLEEKAVVNSTKTNNSTENDEEFYSFLSEKRPDYSMDYKYSDLYCNTHNPDYYGHRD